MKNGTAHGQITFVWLLMEVAACEARNQFLILIAFTILRNVRMLCSIELGAPQAAIFAENGSGVGPGRNGSKRAQRTACPEAQA